MKILLIIIAAYIALSLLIVTIELILRRKFCDWEHRIASLIIAPFLAPLIVFGYIYTYYLRH